MPLKQLDEISHISVLPLLVQNLTTLTTATTNYSRKITSFKQFSLPTSITHSYVGSVFLISDLHLARSYTSLSVRWLSPMSVNILSIHLCFGFSHLPGISTPTYLSSLLFTRPCHCKILSWIFSEIVSAFTVPSIPLLFYLV